MIRLVRLQEEEKSFLKHVSDPSVQRALACRHPTAKLTSTLVYSAWQSLLLYYILLCSALVYFIRLCNALIYFSLLSKCLKPATFFTQPGTLTVSSTREDLTRVSHGKCLNMFFNPKTYQTVRKLH